jgi:hypothetical protein
MANGPIFGLNALAAGTSVTLETTITTPTETGVTGVGVTSSGAGDITIAAALGWSTAATLTLDAFHSIAIDAPITVRGAGGVVLNTDFNDPGGGGYGFGLTASGFQGSLTFANAAGGGQSLTINGSPYTLVFSMSELASELNGSSGNFALAASQDASSDSFTGAVVSSFGGNFTGLGHTISGLTIIDAGANGDDGLFGQQTAGVISDIGLVGGSVSAPMGVGVGDLVGLQSSGSITDAFATGAVSGSDLVGGLVGLQVTGSISDAYATGAVSAPGGGTVGGLVGLLAADALQSQLHPDRRNRIGGRHPRGPHHRGE